MLVLMNSYCGYTKKGWLDGSILWLHKERLAGWFHIVATQRKVGWMVPYCGYTKKGWLDGSILWLHKERLAGWFHIVATQRKVGWMVSYCGYTKKACSCLMLLTGRPPSPGVICLQSGQGHEELDEVSVSNLFRFSEIVGVYVTLTTTQYHFNKFCAAHLLRASLFLCRFMNIDRRCILFLE